MAKKSKQRPAEQRQEAPQVQSSWRTKIDWWTNPQGPRPLLPTLAALWLVFAATEWTLNTLILGNTLGNGQLPLGARFSLASYATMVVTGFVFVIGGTLLLLARLGESRLAAWPVTRWVGRRLVTLLVWLIFLLYGVSWASFRQTGKFLDHEILTFVAPHPLQVFHWVDRDVAIGTIGLTLATAVLLAEWIPRWVENRGPLTKHFLVRVCGVVVGLSILGGLVGELYSGWGERKYMRAGILYATTRDNATGPLPFFLASIRWHLRERPEETWMGDKAQIIQRPIISMEQYLSQANSRQLNRWNVIILIAESLRADQIRAYGGTRDIMPTVDALAGEGRVFLNSYTQASHTHYAVLVPLSSHYPLRSAKQYAYPPNPTFPRVLIYDVLKALGYRTAIFSSSNENWGGMVHYLQTGNLDRFFHAPTSSSTQIAESDTGFAAWVKETKHAGSVDDRFTIAQAIQWIDSLKQEPFFMYINLQNSHLPYVVPKDFPRRFSPPELDFTIRFGHFPMDKIDTVKDVYADSLAYVDAQIARLVQHLRSRGLWDRTVIVLTSDHGQAFYEHGFAAHGSQIFNEVMKVPLIIRAPGLSPGLDDRVAQHLDVPPSILDLLRLPPHPSFQGISLFDSKKNPNRAVYMVSQTSLAYQYGIIRSRFKLIYDERQQQYLLYDLVSDPAEKNDLARDKPAVVDELAQRLHTWSKLQLDYYKDEELHRREYPPVLSD